MMSESLKRSLPRELPLKYLTYEEWRLLIAAVAAYRHNEHYQAIHMKLLAQHALSAAINE
jgi:quinol monooxygenase YgiN